MDSSVEIKGPVFVSIDLELEQPKTKKQTKDSSVEVETIIQIGVTFFSLNKDGEPTILKQLLLNIHYPHKISAFIKALTGIADDDVNNSIITIEDARALIEYEAKILKASNTGVEWGGGDFNKLFPRSRKENYFKSSIDVKHIFKTFAVTNGFNVKCGLAKSMLKAGINFKCVRIDGKNLGSHNALADSYNTARFFNFLLTKSFIK